MTTRRILIMVLVFVACATAQQPTAPPTATQQLQAWRESRAAVLMDDFGELSRYRKANAALAMPVAGEDRVVFLGDSITDFWDLAKSFPRKPYINRGISGQTTSQMLLRFHQDVVDLHPRAVVILAGTNDIAGNTGPISLDDIEANYAAMAEMARANGISVIFSSVLPVNNYTAKSKIFFPLRPPQQIEALNNWLKQYCSAQGDTYLDYFSAMVDANGMLKRQYAKDGLHPNEAGYAVMAPLAESAIRKVLRIEASPKEKPGN